ncbi:MAG TPA: hypothetical protein VNT50_02705 [Microbacterium sp.]|uniref:hypothetical protein n=1 Tax=Microbacterium sp. TaxID=51671 RepID=UPI002BC159D3|nr:hypothetical protein [Microbacterium sp.]HWI30373.1 hypothetical protein [Microbacterium sp.]
MTIPMSTTVDAVTDDSAAEPRLSPDARERIQRAGRDLWRVLDPSGHVIGHVQSLRHPLGTRFVAKRYHAPTTRFRELGEFWSADDAAACLRYSV